MYAIYSLHFFAVDNTRIIAAGVLWQGIRACRLSRNSGNYFTRAIVYHVSQICGENLYNSLSVY